MGGLLAARLASALGASGMICLDAALPPESGQTATVDPAFHSFVKSLPLEDGTLPPWNEWWPIDVFEGVDVSPDLRARVLGDIPRLPLNWFDDTFEMPPWPETKRAFVRTSSTFIQAAQQAEALGWAVEKLRGTHMHPATHPDQTAKAIISCCRKMGLV